MTCRPYFSAGTIFWPSVVSCVFHAEHDRNVRSVDVAVDHPDLLPHFASASARLTATVVLPTPPLPAPTAMTFFTPGIGCRPPSAPTASRTHGAHVHVDGRHAGNLHDRRARLIAHLVFHRTGRRGQFDRERDASAIDRRGS